MGDVMVWELVHGEEDWACVAHWSSVLEDCSDRVGTLSCPSAKICTSRS